MSVSCNRQIECCISEWTSGMYNVSNWKEGDYESVYRSHIKSLSDLPDRYSPHSGGLGRIQHDLLRNARYDMLLSNCAFPYTCFTTSIHAGAPFELSTGPEEPRPGALGVAVQEAPTVYTDPGIGKLNPTIDISFEP